MAGHIKIYREQYENLPERFQKKLEQDLQYLMDAKISGLKKIYLFGSCARGEVRSTSDIDLLIVTEDRLEDRMLASNIRWTLDEAMEGVRTDVVYTHENAEISSYTFCKAVEQDKKLVMEVTE